MNRLADSTSPYLLQHAANPVDWWPWCDEAFEQARRRDVPVLLSVGYSACHWCHVMAHESFEDPATAALMNEHLVAIKVDREERPDVDAVYMTATQAMTGQGGWPMTVFMTPDREPFYCGTYFPTDIFTQLIHGVAKAWAEDRDNVTGQARKIATVLAERASAGLAALREGGAGEDAEPGPGLAALAAAGDWDPAGPAGRPLAAACRAAVDVLAGIFDSELGGFGTAPKFPPSMVLEFLLREHTRDGADDQAGRALAMAEQTMRAMARGGMYDQLAGGFARYSVDAGWVVPHFEKMLYDNALLTRAYAHLWRLTGSPLARRVTEQTCDWMLSELRTAEGGLAAALDADSDGEEGKFYVWTPDELTAVLGPDDGEFAAQVFGVTPGGTFERGRSVLQLPEDPADAERFGRVRAALLAAREQRTRPGRDDKVVAAWNGMAIAALAEAGLLLGRPDFTAAATAAANLLARVHLTPTDSSQPPPAPSATSAPSASLTPSGAPASSPTSASPAPSATSALSAPPASPVPTATSAPSADPHQLAGDPHRPQPQPTPPPGAQSRPPSPPSATSVPSASPGSSAPSASDAAGDFHDPRKIGAAIATPVFRGSSSEPARLVRTSRDGVAGDSAGLLEDYACVAEGFLVLSGVTGEHSWLDLAGRLLGTALDRFADGQGGFFDTADDGEPLLYRPADPTDNATPSGAFAVAAALLSYAALTGSRRHRAAAMAALSPLPALAGRYPQAAGAGLSVAEALLAGPAEIAVVGPPDDPRTAALHAAALRATSPGAVVALGDGGGRAGAPRGTGVPLLAGREMVDGNPAAYVCRNFTCRLPVTDPAGLDAVLSAKK